MSASFYSYLVTSLSLPFFTSSVKSIGIFIHNNKDLLKNKHRGHSLIDGKDATCRCASCVVKTKHK